MPEASRCPLLNSTTAPSGSIIASSRRSVSTRSIHWNERPLAPSRNRPSAGDRSKELPRKKLMRPLPPNLSSAMRSISGSGSMATTSAPAIANAPASIPGPQPRSRTRCSRVRPVNRVTWRISRGAYAGRPARKCSAAVRNRRGWKSWASAIIRSPPVRIAPQSDASVTMLEGRSLAMTVPPKEPSMTQTIALVDDDRNILTSIQMTLEQEGVQVRTYTDGESALQGMNARPVDLAVLDIKMPRMDGMELLQKLRQRSSMPIIFLPSKDEEVDELMGLRLGADDYITKPFSQRLLIERIRALLRRNEASRAEGSGAAPGGVMVRGDLTLDETKHQCIWRGQDIQLTVTEFLLVKALAARPGMVKSRDQLIDAAYGENIYVDDRTIDSHVKRVRKKFRTVDDDFNQIETLYGIGYRYKEH